MYTPIHFSTLQMQLEADALIDAITHHQAKYERNFFPFDFGKLLPEKDLTQSIKKNIIRTYHNKLGSCDKPLSKFTWHMN